MNYIVLSTAQVGLYTAHSQEIALEEGWKQEDVSAITQWGEKCRDVQAAAALPGWADTALGQKMLWRKYVSPPVPGFTVPPTFLMAVDDMLMSHDGHVSSTTGHVFDLSAATTEVPEPWNEGMSSPGSGHRPDRG